MTRLLNSEMLRFRLILLFVMLTIGTFLLGRYSTGEPRPAAPSPLDVAQTAERDWSPFALLLVDIQNEFYLSAPPEERAAYAARVKALLEFCRSEGIEVVHLRTEFAGADAVPPSYQVMFGDKVPCLRGSAGAAPPAFAKEKPGERVFVKDNFNGFSVDALTRHLDVHGKRQVLVAGMTTDLCVLATAIGAVDKGFLVTVVDDCCMAGSEMAHRFVIQRYGNFLFDTVPHSALAHRHPHWARQLAKVKR